MRVHILGHVWGLGTLPCAQHCYRGYVNRPWDYEHCYQHRGAPRAGLLFCHGGEVCNPRLLSEYCQLPGPAWAHSSTRPGWQSLAPPLACHPLIILSSRWMTKVEGGGFIVPSLFLGLRLKIVQQGPPRTPRRVWCVVRTRHLEASLGHVSAEGYEAPSCNFYQGEQVQRLHCLQTPCPPGLQVSHMWVVSINSFTASAIPWRNLDMSSSFLTQNKAQGMNRGASWGAKPEGKSVCNPLCSREAFC